MAYDVLLWWSWFRHRQTIWTDTLLSFIQFPFFSIKVVRGEGMSPAVSGNEDIHDLRTKVGHHQYYIHFISLSVLVCSLPPSMPPSLSVFGRVMVPSFSHKDCHLSIYPFYNLADTVSFLLIKSDFLKHIKCLQGLKIKTVNKGSTIWIYSTLFSSTYTLDIVY